MTEFMGDVQELSVDEIEAVSGGGYNAPGWIAIVNAASDFIDGVVAGVKDAMKQYM